MYAIQWNEVIKRAVKQTGKWACYVSNGLEYGSPRDDKIWRFVLDEFKSKFGEDQFYSILPNLIGSDVFFFDTEEECYKFYEIFNQPLTDSSAIYAATYSPDGQCETENT